MLLFLLKLFFCSSGYVQCNAGLTLLFITVLSETIVWGRRTFCQLNQLCHIGWFNYFPSSFNLIGNTKKKSVRLHPLWVLRPNFWAAFHCFSTKFFSNKIASKIKKYQCAFRLNICWQSFENLQIKHHLLIMLHQKFIENMLVCQFQEKNANSKA